MFTSHADVPYRQLFWSRCPVDRGVRNLDERIREVRVYLFICWFIYVWTYVCHLYFDPHIFVLVQGPPCPELHPLAYKFLPVSSKETELFFSFAGAVKTI